VARINFPPKVKESERRNDTKISCAAATTNASEAYIDLLPVAVDEISLNPFDEHELTLETYKA
jgi:hypothetical protein